MKINSIVYLALFGLVCNVNAAEEAAAEGAAAEEPKIPAVPWFWDSDIAAASEQTAADELSTNEEGGVLMSANFAQQGCAGFRLTDRELIYAARENDCKVSRSQTETGRKDSTSALPLGDLDLLCPNLLKMDQVPRPYDIMIATFNFPVMYSSLDIDGDDFIVTLSDGTFIRPVCALLEPGLEGNEMHSVQLIGFFGGREAGTWPSSIRVVSDLKLYDNIQLKPISAKGLRLDRETGGTNWQVGSAQYGHSMSYESGLVMLKAWAYEFSELGETAGNHCRVDFPTTTHVIKVLMNGQITKDGIHPLIPSDTGLFTVMKARGATLLFNRFIGLADLGTDELWKTWPQIYETDGDNYVDLCLDLGQIVAKDAEGNSVYNDDGTLKITGYAEDPNGLQFVLIKADTVFPPRGTGANIQHMVAVTHPADKVHYPYGDVEDLAMTSVASKLFDIILIEVFEIVGIVTGGVIGILGLPLLGIGLGIGLLFLQAYMPSWLG